MTLKYLSTSIYRKASVRPSLQAGLGSMRGFCHAACLHFKTVLTFEVKALCNPSVEFSK